jgi:hypothetical protein
LIGKIKDLCSVDDFTANYALSTRRYEIEASGFSRDMLGATRVSVNQKSDEWKAGFRMALDVTRYLLPVGENELRF